MRRRLALLGVVWAAVPLLPAGAHAAVYGPPGNRVFWGGIGGYEQRLIRDFDSQSGKHPAVFGYFITWSAKRPALHWLGFRLSDATAERSRVMLNVQPPPGLSPGEIAKGEGDAFLVAMTRLLSENGHVTYMRLLSEMNNGVNPYSPYDLNGRSRGPANSTRSFIAAWRRAAIILKGGDVARIDRRLKRLGQPAARTGADALPTPEVSLVWVPLTFGNPEVEHNHPRHFWPGSAYVDWVGTTWYSKHPNASAMDRFYRYREWRRKPFVFAEWGIWGAESPGFVGNFFGFVKGHPRVRMAIYYQSAGLKQEFRLSTHPRSRAALRTAVRWPRLLGVAPEFGS